MVGVALKKPSPPNAFASGLPGARARGLPGTLPPGGASSLERWGGSGEATRHPVPEYSLPGGGRDRMSECDGVFAPLPLPPLRFKLE